MFLHVGADVAVSTKNIIAIVDLRSAGAAHGGHTVVDISAGQPKSLVITDAEWYLSPISSQTLKKRSDGFFRSLQ